MKNKLGAFATLVVALFAVIQTAAAQDRNDWNRGRFDHDRNRYANNYRPEPNWRARDYRDEGFRERAWREREFRERDRCDRDHYGYGYRPAGPVAGFQYYGR